MSDPNSIRLPKFPFLVFDACLVGSAIWIKLSHQGPEGPGLWVLVIVAILLGGLVGCLPYWLEFRTLARLREFEMAQQAGDSTGIAASQARLEEGAAQIEDLFQRLEQGENRLLERLESQGKAPAEFGKGADERQAALLEQIAVLVEREREELLARLDASQSGGAQGAAFAGLEARMESLAAQLDLLSGRHSEPPATGEESARENDSSPAPGGLGYGSPGAAIEATSPEPLPPSTPSAGPEAVEVPPVPDRQSDSGKRVAETGAYSEPEADWDEEFDSSEEVSSGSVLEVADEPFDESAETPLDEPEETFPGDEPPNEMLASASAADSETLPEIGNAPDEPGEVTDRGAYVPLDDSFDAPAPEAPDAIVEMPEGLEEDFATGSEESAFPERVEADREAALMAADEVAADESGDSASAASVAASDFSGDPGEEVANLMQDEDWGEGWGEEETGEELIDEDVQGASQPELIEGADGGPPKARKAGRKDTTLIAQVLIGIGNKPYVRGEGPGLSPDEGVPMEFLEIGKWQWTAPDSTAPLRVQIYKNDEIPAQEGWIDLEPGQRRSVTPRFG
ncbi:MAG: hypothetical protein ACFB21_14805 [Opitutales bacterium]